MTRAQALAQVVVDRMGGTFDNNDTLSHFWQAASDKEKKLRKCVQHARAADRQHASSLTDAHLWR